MVTTIQVPGLAAVSQTARLVQTAGLATVDSQRRGVQAFKNLENEEESRAALFCRLRCEFLERILSFGTVRSLGQFRRRGYSAVI
jgi:hypothetical protein